MKRFRISVLFLCLALAALPQGCEKGQVFELSCVVVEYIVNPKFQVLPQDQGASKGNSVDLMLYGDGVRVRQSKNPERHRKIAERYGDVDLLLKGSDPVGRIAFSEPLSIGCFAPKVESGQAAVWHSVADSLMLQATTLVPMVQKARAAKTRIWNRSDPPACRIFKRLRDVTAADLTLVESGVILDLEPIPPFRFHGVYRVQVKSGEAETQEIRVRVE